MADLFYRRKRAARREIRKCVRSEAIYCSGFWA